MKMNEEKNEKKTKRNQKITVMIHSRIIHLKKQIAITNITNNRYIYKGNPIFNT